MLELKNLHFRYKTQQTICDVSCQMTTTQCVAMVGPNGSGKSTILNLIAGLLKPDAGQIHFENRDLKKLNQAAKAKLIAVSRNAQVEDWPLSVRSTVLLGRTPHRGWIMPFTNEDQEIVDRCMNDCGVIQFQDRLTSELSDGERQRVSLARAIAQQPRILLLDEPTSNLDLKHQVEILRLVKKLKGNSCIVIAAIHDLTLAARWADVVMMLSQGQIKDFGPPKIVFKKELIERVFGTSCELLKSENGDAIVPKL
jgi:iron complex transport system ATP-binding protein